MTLRTRSVNLSCMFPRPPGASGVAFGFAFRALEPLTHQPRTIHVTSGRRHLGALEALQMSRLSQDQELVQHVQRTQSGKAERDAEPDHRAQLDHLARMDR